MFADTTPTPTIPTSGDFWNPTSWVPFVHEIGIPGFFALVFFAYIVWKEWRNSKQPSNREQVTTLRWMYHDAVERNARLRRVLRSFCSVVSVFADMLTCTNGEKIDVARRDIKSQIDKITDALDDGPPTTPAILQLKDEDKDEDA